MKTGGRNDGSAAKTILFFTLIIFPAFFVQAQEKTDNWLRDLLASKASPLLKHVLDNPDSFQYQVIYTKIDRDKNNKPRFTDYYLHVDRNRYFNPASTVKLPTALIALEKINELRKEGITIYTPMMTDSSYTGQTRVSNDSSSENTLPSVAQYLRKIFLTSDNDAYNRLYEFDGQYELNRRLWNKGFTDTRIVRRFVTATEDENRHTNGIRFITGSKTFIQPPAYDTLTFDYNKEVLVGRGHFNRYDSLINSPMDFTRHNNLPLEDLSQMLRSVLFPGAVPAKQRFAIDGNDLRFLYQYMSEYPSESTFPNYDTSEYFDSYTKFFMFKSGKQKIPANIRIFNKPGWSYGYLTDAAYIVDYAANTEFMLSAVIYVNRDGILNDDKYEYKEIGYPFFKEVGEIMYAYDKTRKRTHKPDLSAFKFDYSKK